MPGLQTHSSGKSSTSRLIFQLLLFKLICMFFAFLPQKSFEFQRSPENSLENRENINFSQNCHIQRFPSRKVIAVEDKVAFSEKNIPFGTKGLRRCGSCSEQKRNLQKRPPSSRSHAFSSHFSLQLKLESRKRKSAKPHSVFFLHFVVRKLPVIPNFMEISGLPKVLRAPMIPVLKLGGWNFACSFYSSEITDIRGDLAASEVTEANTITFSNLFFFL